MRGLSTRGEAYSNGFGGRPFDPYPSAYLAPSASHFTLIRMKNFPEQASEHPSRVCRTFGKVFPRRKCIILELFQGVELRYRLTGSFGVDEINKIDEFPSENLPRLGSLGLAFFAFAFAPRFLKWTEGSRRSHIPFSPH